jgi:phage gp29-like protein
MMALLGVSAYQPPANDAISLDDEAVVQAREALGGQLTPRPTTQTRWFLRDIEDAQVAADSGDLTKAARLCNAMRADGVLSGVLSTRTDGVIALPKRWRGAGYMLTLLQYGGDSVRSVFDEMFPPAELALLASDGILLGVAVGELVPVTGRDYPVLVRHNPEFLIYRRNENRWYLRTIAGLVAITPGDGRWILHTPGGRMDPWRNGIWRAVGTAWVNKVHASLHDQNWQSKLANPARVATAPQGATDEQSEEWFRRVMAWGVNTVFGLKPGYQVSLLESNGRGHESFDVTIKRSDREFVICVAGQEVTTTGGTGFVNANVHQAIRADLIKSTADALAYTLNTQGIPPWVIERWGEPGLAQSPCVEWNVQQPRDAVQEASALMNAANAIDKLIEVYEKRGVEIDLAELSVRFNIPVKGDVDGDGKADASRDKAPGGVVRDIRRAA